MDKTPEISHNNKQELPALDADGEQTSINKSEMVSMNDPKCEHVWVIDPTEDDPNFYGMKCSKCIIGMLIAK